MSKLSIILAFALLTGISSFSQQADLFRFEKKYSAPTEVVSAGTQLVLNRPLLQKLYLEKPAAAEIRISLEGEVLVLKVNRVSLFSYNRPDIILASTLRSYSFSPGYYVRGKIEGKEKSLVALSIFENGAGGVLSFNGQNYNLCVANASNDFSSDTYLLYSEKDLHVTPQNCLTEDGQKPINIANYAQRPLVPQDCPVDIYFELANEMYTGLGSNSENVLRFFTILFNCMQALYESENILVQIREIKIWDVPDPEQWLTTTRDVLYDFSRRMDNGFNGDLAHYVTFTNLGGGIAWRDQLCASTDYYKTAVSANIDPFYATFPNYSFTVQVLAHETGHNLGSPHTHNCMWPGGPIDNCYPVDAGPCAAGPQPPSGGGTIMSYCHLSSTGIDFSNGFGPLPGNLIRTNVAAAANAGCICSCSDIELSINTQDIGCGNPTGTAVPVIVNGAGPFTFEWSNGTTDSIATGLAAGTYYVKVSGIDRSCTVIKGFKIASTGNAISTNLTPSATTVLKCLNESHTINASVTPAGAYTYQWYKDNLAVTGAVSSSYTANASGAFYVKVNSNGCAGQSQTVNLRVENIAPFNITANGATNICVNDSVRLSVPASPYTIEWLLNGNVIPGAAATNFMAKLAGDYTVRIFSPGNNDCVRVSDPVSVLVKPAPGAFISPSGTVNICYGQSATLVHTALAGDSYQWYNGNTALMGETNALLTKAIAGLYQLEVTNVNGCRTKSSVASLVINPLPDSAISPFPSFALCQGGTLKLEVKPAAENTTYTWYDGTRQLASSNANFYNATQQGAYSAIIKNNITGCESSSGITNINMIAPPSIFAGSDTILATGQPFRLRAFERSNLGVNRYEWSPSTGLDNPYIANPTTTLFQDQLYTVKGTNPLGCYGTATVKFTVYKGPAMYVPGAFSPNGDGINELVKCFAVGLQSFKYFEIYNRNGERIFRTINTTTGWDGTLRGNPVDPGTYVWVAEGIDYNGKPMVKKGTVVLVR